MLPCLNGVLYIVCIDSNPVVPSCCEKLSAVECPVHSCAARHYHEAMVANGGRSELAIVPLDQQRCYSIGVPGDPTLPAGQNLSRFCSSPNMTSINHTQGFSGMVEPLTRFLLKHVR